MMNIATIAIGLPGSGKTTILRELATDIRSTYVCPDDIRAEVTSDVADQSRNEEIWAETYRRIHAALDAGTDVIVDATNTIQPERHRLIDHCKIKTNFVSGLWFTTPDYVCLERNRRRERNVPEVAMGIMIGWLQASPPSVSEGFTLLTKIKT